MTMQFKDRIVGVTGYSSNHIDYESMIYRIVTLENGLLSGDVQDTDEWEIEQLIFIGDQDFNKEYLIKSIEVGIEHNFTCKYFAIEAFWDIYSENDCHEPYYENDPRIEKHAGLSFLASLHFKFPTVDIFGFRSKNSSNVMDLNSESLLKLHFGYSVRNGISKSERRNALGNAVKSPHIISLKGIAEHIAYLINTRKKKADMISAVERWSEDLEWLKNEHYNKSVQSFIFPTPN